MMERETHVAEMEATMMQQCIDICMDTHATVLQTIAHCLEMGGKHVSPQHITMMLDCAQICQTSADYMLRHSPLHGRTCGLCAEVCELCAQSCEMFPDDEQMMACAQECRRCAASCREMANMMAQ